MSEHFQNIPPRLTTEEILWRAGMDKEFTDEEFEEALKTDLSCLGEEPSDDELIEDEKRRNRALEDKRALEEQKSKIGFCLYCGAGLGKNRRDGEGTCPQCKDK